MDRPRRDRRPRRELWRDRRELRPFSSARPATEGEKCVPLLSPLSFSRFGISRPPPSDVGAGAAVVAPERREDAAECRVVVERNRRASAAGPRRPETTWVGESQTGEALDYSGCRSTRVVARRGDRSGPCLPARLCPARRTRWSRRTTPRTRSRGSLGRSTRFWSGTRSSASGRRRVSHLLEGARKPITNLHLLLTARLPSPCVRP